jgi:hypothetical protein
MQVDLGALSFAEGGYLLVKRAVRRVAPGASVCVRGQTADLEVHLRAWCRAEGHRFEWEPSSAGSRRMMQLMHDMDEGRRKRLVRVGFSEKKAAELSALHTRNFM